MLWKNGGLHLLGRGVLLSAVYKSTAGVAVVDSNVYIAGQYPDTTFAGGYWKNGVWTPINNGSFTPSSIAAIGGKVYIPGYTYIRAPGSFTQRAAYWVDGTLVPLDGLVAMRSLLTTRISMSWVSTPKAISSYGKIRRYSKR
jgi:hypothetical protein